MYQPRPFPAALVACLAVLSALAVPAGASSPPARAERGTTPVVAQERVTVAGRVPGRVRRPVVLQSRDGGRWEPQDRARSTARGGYTWRLRAPARTTRYRVVAPPTRVGARHLRAFTSRVTTLRPVRQRGASPLPPTVRTGTRVAVGARFLPARPGRPVAVQASRGGAWTTLATLRQDRAGRTSYVVTVDATTRYRVVAQPWRGAPAVATAPQETRAVDAPVGDTPWVTGYYAGWFWESYAPDLVDMSAMTHLVFGRVAPGGGSLDGEPGRVVLGAGTAHDPGLAPDGVRSVEDYLVDRAHAAGGQALLMLGGDGADGRGFMLSAADDRRARFVDAVVDHLVVHDYDGVDVDWENCLHGEAGCGEAEGRAPLPAAEARRRLRELIADIRTETATRARYAQEPALVTFPGYALNTNDLVHTGGRAPAWQADIAQRVDQYNLMAYGVGTTWWGHGTGWESWFSGALTGQSPSTPVDIASSVAAYVAAGVPAARIGIGIGFYGIYYGPTITGPRQYDERNDIYEVSDTALGWATLREKGYFDHGTRMWDAEAQSTYRTYGDGTPESGYVPASDPAANPAGFLSYEDGQSIAAKADWVEEHGVGGTILWTVNYGWADDLHANPLLDAVKAEFLG
ncbi:glycosyl hydrolase family 18 protein [Nocardioides sp. 503]|uniref:glycosyl hydrolase family 18 protein n=1 Tax=Nocardioides sp. 503 TaxID=2508326 RepID=UPI0010705781|nr:glycosyl hydrolase family 18 protein [Nocardioides sp. 503]